MKPRVHRLQHGVRAEHPGKSHMLQLDEWSLPLSASIDRVYLDTSATSVQSTRNLQSWLEPCLSPGCLASS